MGSQSRRKRESTSSGRKSEDQHSSLASRATLGVLLALCFGLGHLSGQYLAGEGKVSSDGNAADVGRLRPKNWSYAENYSRGPKLYCSVELSNLRPVIERLGWKWLPPEDYELCKFIFENSPEYRTPHNRTQLISYVRGFDELTDKSRLQKNLYRFSRDLGYREKVYDIDRVIPETYAINEDDDCARFFREIAPSRPNFTWIRKPANLAQGEGMYIVTPSRMRSIRASCYNKTDGSCFPECVEGDYLMQRYITNPLLLKGRKSEIRSYWLIANTEPLMVLFHEGTVRLNTERYKNEDWDNLLVHITNTAQQEKADPARYERVKDSLKWTLDDLQQYLFEEGVVSNHNWIDEYLKPILKGYLAYVVNATKERLVRKQGSFQLLGMDTILDDELHPWLTEIQLGPGLSSDNPIKKVVVPRMLNEIVNIEFEIDERMYYNQQVQQLDSVQHFEWVINEAVLPRFYYR